MILTFEEDIANNARLLLALDANAVNEFCETALKFLRFGMNTKVCANVAQKLAIDFDSVKNAFDAIMFIVSQATRFSLTESDFGESLSELGFEDTTVTSMVTVYENNKYEIRQILSKMDMDSNELPVYTNVEWRTEVLLSSRMFKEHMKPRIILRFEFSLGKGKKSFLTLQCDPANLIHLHDSLEEAFAESRSQHVLKMLRLLK